MARINLDDEFFGDPRMDALSEMVGSVQAIGSIVKLWKLGQSYWKRKKGLIPLDVFDLLPNSDELIKSGWVERREGGAYCKGAEERWAFLLVRSKNGEKGGKISARRPRDEKGRLLPKQNPSKDPAIVQAKPSKPKPSSSSSSYKNTKGGKEPPKKQSKLDPTLVACYKTHYKTRYHRYPIVSGKDLGILLRVQEQVEVEKTKTLLEAYLKSNNEWFKTNQHDLATFENKLNVIEGEIAESLASPESASDPKAWRVG